MNKPLCQDWAHPTVSNALSQGMAGHKGLHSQGLPCTGGTKGQSGAARSQGPCTARPLIPHRTFWVSQLSGPALCTQKLSEEHPEAAAALSQGPVCTQQQLLPFPP